MKTLRLIGTILLSILIAFSISSCGGDDDPTTPTPTPTPTNNAKIEIPATENTKPLLSQSGGSASVTFSATSNWTASSSASWCSVSPVSGQAGTASLTFTVTENVTYDDRVAIITLKSGNASQTITVSQVQKDAIILALKEHEVAYNATSLDFAVQTNVQLSVSISDDAKSWISQTDTRALHSETLHFNLVKNDGETERTGVITIQGGDVTQTVNVKQGFDFLTKERAVLMDLYNATEGDHWINNDNWGSDKPLSEWYGVQTNSSGSVNWLNLCSNNLTGVIPESIGKLINLRILYLVDNHLSGCIPDNIGNLTKLEELSLQTNKLTGSIPESIGNLNNLTFLNLSLNQLTGSIPESIGGLEKINILFLQENQLSGSIPESIGNLANLTNLRLYTNQLTNIPDGICNLANLKILDLNSNKLSGQIPTNLGNLINLESLNIGFNEELSGSLPDNIGDLTHLQYLVTQYSPISGTIPESLCNLTELKVFAAAYSNFSGSLPENFGNLRSLEDIRMCGNHLSGPLPESIGNLMNLKILMIRWNELSGELPATMGNMTSLESIYLEGNKLTGGIPDSFMNLSNLKWLNVSGNCMDGSISDAMYQSAWWNQVYTSIAQRSGYGLKIGNAYISTDFSKDGEVKVLQRHSKGKGIGLVITGDGFSDRLIADGTFGNYVNKAMESFFDKEPFISFRDYFDVYCVTAVSKNDILGLETVFESKVAGDKYNYNLNTIRNYVSLVPDFNSNLSNVTTLVILNDAVVGSRVNCTMYTDGFSIGFCTVSDIMKEEINHEIGGHGFGRLADEYWSDDESSTSFTDKSWLDWCHNEGVYVNVDYENDPQKVIWKDFINNADYKVENIGVYEGGFAEFTYGIYRPTEYSIMRNNVGEYNAPSRWAIYKRIKELAGESYTFQDFLAYDKKNLERIAKDANTRSYVEKSAVNVNTSQLGAPPIIYNYPSSEIGMH